MGPIVQFTIPHGSRVDVCPCGVVFAWITLPTGGRMRVDVETREPHDARCPKKRPSG